MSLGNALQHLLPTPTFAGLRAAQVDLEIEPTPDPLSPHRVEKRLNGNPAICGYVEGDESMFGEIHA